MGNIGNNTTTGLTGTMHPKFIFDLGGANEQEVHLEHWVEIDFDYDTRSTAHEDQLEADRDFLERGEYLDITGKLYLFKYPDVKVKFDEIYQFRKKKVVFFSHVDGDMYRDKDGNPVLFYIEYIIPKYLGILDYRDVLYMRFRSLTEVNHSQMIYPVLVDDNQDSLTDDDDEILV